MEQKKCVCFDSESMASLSAVFIGYLGFPGVTYLTLLDRGRENKKEVIGMRKKLLYF